MRGSIRWFVENPIAANLLMVFLFIGGFLGASALNKQFFPEFELNTVSVNMPYPGAGPREVEEQICQRIEEAVHDLNGVREVRSTARYGSGTVLIEAEHGYDVQRLTAEVKTRVDAITTFPTDAERPSVTELAHRHRMAVLALAGDIGEGNLKQLGEQLRDDLAGQPHVSVVELTSPRAYEVSIELSEYTLRRYGLSFGEVVAAIRNSSLNLPAGSIKTEGGDIQLQTRGQAYVREDFEKIPLRSTRDGVQLVLGDVASVVDGFEDLNVRTRFNDKPSHSLSVYSTADPNTLITSEAVHSWVEKTRPGLPPGVELVVWQDSADGFRGRVNTLVNNGMGGLVLVFLVLMLFLRPLLAVWVCVGIAVAFMGTLFALQFTGVGLHMMSLFAFLLILGIVVDDAIIVGEAIHSRQTAGDVGAAGAVAGALSVRKPVMYAVISTMIFFVPMMLVEGDMATISKSIPVVVILALGFSLVECLWILPSHLAQMPPPAEASGLWLGRFERWRQGVATAMVNFARLRYRPFLRRCLQSNLLLIALFSTALLLSLALYGGGWVSRAFFPVVVSDYITAKATLPEGGAYSATEELLAKLEASAIQLKREYNSASDNPDSTPVIGHINSRGWENDVRVTLVASRQSSDVSAIAMRWRELIGDPGEVESFALDFTINERGKAIRLVLASPSLQDLQAVVQELYPQLESYPGVYNINDTLQSPRREMVLTLKPAAENLSVTLADLARQVRQAFYGAEAQRIPRTTEDVRVMVRYPQRERLSTENLSNMRVRTPAGMEVPFDTVAEFSFQPAYVKIKRLDRQRTLEVSAELLPGTSAAGEVVRDLLDRNLDDWQKRYPGLSVQLDGEQKEESAFLGSLLKYMALSMLVIYAMMAVAFRSYGQPLLVLTAIPFGIMGGILGHVIMDMEVSMLSMLGVLACAGVVVNDNLVLIDRVNQLRQAGVDLFDALLEAGQDRFRPIILTSLTTFVGLLPIMSETSVQAQFLIPMVVSLAFGVLFATPVTLILVPCLYLFGGQVAGFLTNRRRVALS